jgi:FeS assembly SUF system regulator
MAPETQVHAALEISTATGIALPTVSKVLKSLLKAEILSSIRGAKGGYALVQPPEKITVASVITALEGPIALTECSALEDSCEQVSGCQIGNHWPIRLSISCALVDINTLYLFKRYKLATGTVIS